MKNIAILVPTLNKGGAERVAANLSLEFDKYYNVYLIVHDGRNISYPYSGKLIDLELPPSNTVVGKIFTLIKRVNRVRAIKKKYNIDYTISHLPPSNNVNILSRGRGKTITYVHSMLGIKGSGFWLRKFKEWGTAQLSDYVICVSECVRENMIKNFHVSSDKAQTIYNFIDLCNIDSQIAKNDENTISTVVSMGRLASPKGQWHLIRAMKNVCFKYPETRLILLGDGELKSELVELTKKLGLDNNIIFKGYTSNPFSIISQSSVYVSPSNIEGLPMALLEAARCSIPIISTDCDAGCREILAPNTPISKKTRCIEEAEYGLLVPVCNDNRYTDITLSEREEIMAEAIIKLISSHELRTKYGELAFKRSEDFSSDKIMEKWKELLK